jgi:hypothetical protein
MLSTAVFRIILEEQKVEYRDGTLIREDGTDLMFVVMDGRLSVIENNDIFDTSNATTVDTTRLGHLGKERGPTIGSDAYLAVVDGNGYLINNGVKRHFTSEAAIAKYNVNRSKFRELTHADLPTSAGTDLG